MKNIVAYVRVSHEEQVKYGFSLDAQKEALKEWADNNGVTILHWYVDEGVSARKKVKNRPQLQQMLRDVQRGGIDLIIFIKLDRYFRSVAEYHETQKILEMNGVHWKAIKEDYDTTTTDGRFKINIMLSIAEQEADRTSDRIKFTFEHKVKKKQPISGQQPFGYKIGVTETGEKCVIIDENAAPIVRAVFEHFSTYQSVSAATDFVNSELGCEMTFNSVRKILKNTYYYGHYRGVNDYCPAYISEYEFNQIQYVISNKNIKTPQTRRVYLFTGILKCPKCGQNMTSQTSGVYLNYRCNRAYKHKLCDFKKSFSERKIEQWLLSAIRPMLAEYITEIDFDKPKPKNNGNKSEIIAEMDRLNYLFQKSRIGVDAYEKHYAELETRLATLEKLETEQIDISHVLDFLNSDVLDLYETISREDKRAAWRSIISEIVVDPNGNHTVNFL